MRPQLFELEMMDRLFVNPRYSLRLWVVSGSQGGTYCNIDWVVSDEKGMHPHSAKIGRFTWNGELDSVRRGMICAMDSVSQSMDGLPPLTVR